MKLRMITTVAAMVLSLAAVASVDAAPITGGVQFGGSGVPIGPSVTDFYTATGVDFTNPWLVTGNTGGSYAGVPLGTQATFTDISWGAGSGAVNLPLAQTVWQFTVGALTYTLTVGTVSNIDRGTVLNDNISVQGTGTLSITGVGSTFDPTAGTWQFTGGFTPGGTANLSFSSDAVAPVPEPASLLLLGGGLAGVAARYRRRLAGRRA